MQGQQVARFDTVRFNQAGRFAVGFSVFEVDSGYITFSIQKGSDLLSQNIYTTLYDTVGAVVDEREFATYQQDWFGTCSPVTKDTSCFYAAVGRFGVLV